MVNFIVTNFLFLLVFAIGVICGAVAPPLTAWGVKQYRQLKAKWAKRRL